MKENKSRFGWQDWANFETIDADGDVEQFEFEPTIIEGQWFVKSGASVSLGTVENDFGIFSILRRYEPEATVVDQLNDIHYLPGGGANFRLTVTDGTTEQTAAVDLFEFLIWAQAGGLIDSYSAENVGEEVVILPVPDEEQSHRATAQVKRLYTWLQQLPLATFTRALNERPAMWTAFDENMEPINA